MVLSYLFFIIIPISTITYINYSRSSEIIINDSIEITDNAVNMTIKNIEPKMKNILNVMGIICTDQKIQEILGQNKADYKLSQQIEDAAYLSESLRAFQNDDLIERVKLYVKDGLIYSDEGLNIFNVSDVKNEGWYGNVLENKGTPSWINPHEQSYIDTAGKINVISVARAVISLKTFGKIQGIVMVDIKESALLNILIDNKLFKNERMFIIDSQGSIICSINDAANNTDAYPFKKWFDKSAGEWEKVKFQGNDMLLSCSAINHTPWKLVALIDYNDLVAPSKSLRNYSMLIAILVGITAFLFSLLYSYSITKRIGKLVKVVKNAGKGNLKPLVNVIHKDELSELENDFNYMLKCLSEMFDEQLSMGKKIKELELKALQTQINPHFLYNTLDLINCKARNGYPEEIEEIVDTLARFYKLSLSKGKDIVTIGDELAHIKAYTFIQNKRFKNSIDLEFDIDHEIQELLIIKLILQPIVENSIIHGIMEKPSRKGLIRISAEKKGGDISIHVWDDGIGMDGLTLSQLNNGYYEGNSSGGFGIKHVKERLVLNYGPRYGVWYESCEKEWTAANILIPAQICVDAVKI